ncbi:DUF3916 domain-containing protein [Pseudomonas sp. ANT_H12B]|uniref:DUF3916 domain-containing protein n=1 Tax=Pseudomonas sp. ANT_H12B TaxID=2597348 RepID=UPI0015B39FA5|nr:hypothetical protein [Pseudomonas sp. ANT_H12B]
MNQRGERHTTTPEILLGAYIATALGDTQPPCKPATSQVNFPTQIPDCLPLTLTPNLLARTDPSTFKVEMNTLTMRRLALSNKKIRNIPRRLKALAAWSCRFEGYFFDNLTLDQKYSNWKIPVITTLVEGKQATAAIRKECAQAVKLINRLEVAAINKPSQLRRFYRQISHTSRAERHFAQECRPPMPIAGETP